MGEKFLNEHNEESNQYFAQRLTAWFLNHRRFMPWREEPTPYHVWISEIMLQQTRVDTVIPYYDRFLQLFPDVETLSDAPEDRLLKAWEGLGYYSRVRNLQKAARMVMSEYDGVIPGEFEELKKLPGIGSYTAGAISSIAFQKREPVCDGNVLRVLSRVFGKYEDISEPAVRVQMENALRSFLLKHDEIIPGDFNQALMELGALVCIPNGAPKCSECPVRDYCIAQKNDLTEILPVKNRKNTRKIERKSVFIITDGNQVLLKKRPEKGLLAGLYGFPESGEILSEKLEDESKIRDFVLKELLKFGLFRGEDALDVDHFKGKDNPDVDHIKGKDNPDVDLFTGEDHFDLCFSEGGSDFRVTRLSSEKHIFTHVEWHMDAFLILLSHERMADLNIDSQVYVRTALDEKASEYALPSAYKKWNVSAFLKK